MCIFSVIYFIYSFISRFLYCEILVLYWLSCLLRYSCVKYEKHAREKQVKGNTRKRGKVSNTAAWYLVVFETEATISFFVFFAKCDKYHDRFEKNFR